MAELDHQVAPLPPTPTTSPHCSSRSASGPARATSRASGDDRLVSVTHQGPTPNPSKANRHAATTFHAIATEALRPMRRIWPLNLPRLRRLGRHDANALPTEPRRPRWVLG